MALREIIEKKEKSMIELIIIITLMAVLMMVFIRSFFNQEQHITGTAFNSLAHAFASKVQIVHSQWLMDNQPNVVILQSWNKNEVELVYVNSHGWIDTQLESEVCQVIWQQAMSVPLAFMKSPVAAIELVSGQNSGHVCRYQIEEQLFFDYDSSTGKVELNNHSM